MSKIVAAFMLLACTSNARPQSVDAHVRRLDRRELLKQSLHQPELPQEQERGKSDSGKLKKRYAFAVLLLLGLAFSLHLNWASSNKITELESEVNGQHELVQSQYHHVVRSVNSARQSQQHTDEEMRTALKHLHADIEQLEMQSDQRFAKVDAEQEDVRNDMKMLDQASEQAFLKLAHDQEQTKMHMSGEVDTLSAVIRELGQHVDDTHNKQTRINDDMYRKVDSVRRTADSTEQKLAQMQQAHKKEQELITEQLDAYHAATKRDMRELKTDVQDVRKHTFSTDENLSSLRSHIATMNTNQQGPTSGDGGTSISLAKTARGACEIVGAVGSWFSARKEQAIREEERKFEQDFIKRLNRLAEPRFPDVPMHEFRSTKKRDPE